MNVHCFPNCGDNVSEVLPPWPPYWAGGAPTPPIDPTVLAVTCPTIPSTAVVNTATTIRVIGQNFTNTCQAFLDNVGQATTFVSATELTFQATGTTAKTSTITVKDGATVATGTCQFTWTAAAILTVVCPLNPISAAVGTPALQVTVNGTLFNAGCEVLLDGTPVATTYVSATQLRGTIDPSAETARIAQIGVRDPVAGTQAVVTCPFEFTQVLLVPTIAAVLPDYIGRQGPTVTVNVTGTNFDATSQVTYNGVEVLPTTFVSATQLTAVWDPNVTGVGGFQVRVSNGPLSNASPTSVLLNCVHNPTLGVLDPPSTPANGAGPTTVRLIGSYFGDTAKVLVDNVEVVTNRLSGGTLEFSLPPAPAGTRQISARLGHDHPPHDNVNVVVPPLTLPFTYV